jgi:hypothetical protein
MIDWDLEAPGLHRYFHPFLTDKALISTKGVIDMVFDYQRKVLALENASSIRDLPTRGTTKTSTYSAISPNSTGMRNVSRSLASCIYSPQASRPSNTARALTPSTGRSSTPTLADTNT